MKNKVLFIILPKIWNYLPLPGVAYLIEFLEKNSIETFLLDFSIYNEYNKSQILKEISSVISKNKITHLAFSTYNTNFLISLEIAYQLKNEYRNNIKIIFGGPAIFYFYFFNEKYLLNDYIDYYVIGEGEIPLLEILKNNISKKIIKFIQSKNLDIYPFPTYKKFKLSNYKRKNAIPIVASRGCINKCKFCAERLIFPYYRTRKAENIFKEIKYHYTVNNIRWFTFYDSLFNGNLKNIEKLLDLIISEDLKISWDAQIAIRNDMNENLIKKIKKSGCINLFIGLETGSKTILKSMNKRFTLNEAENFFKLLNDNGINFEISLILNYPGETEKNFNESISFILQNKKYIKKIAQINPYIYYPNTEVNIKKGLNLYRGYQKVEYLLNILKEHKIKYTNAYINNLLKL